MRNFLKPLPLCSLHSLLQFPPISPGSDMKTAHFVFGATRERLGEKMRKERDIFKSYYFMVLFTSIVAFGLLDTVTPPGPRSRKYYFHRLNCSYAASHHLEGEGAKHREEEERERKRKKKRRWKKGSEGKAKEGGRGGNQEEMLTEHYCTPNILARQVRGFLHTAFGALASPVTGTALVLVGEFRALRWPCLCHFKQLNLWDQKLESSQ